MTENWPIVEVTADRLKEIHETYSGDTISNKTIRRPFTHEGRLFVSVAGRDGGGLPSYEKCYRIVLREQFDGPAAWYGQPNSGADWAAKRRSQPEGFYHGMLIQRGRSEWVLVGPPLIFQQKQGSVSTQQPRLL